MPKTTTTTKLKSVKSKKEQPTPLVKVERRNVPNPTTTTVATVYYKQKAQNHVILRSLLWPKLSLYTPFHKNQQCHTCFTIRKTFLDEFYPSQQHKDKIDPDISIYELLDVGYEPKYLELSENEEDDNNEKNQNETETFERHSHAIVINDEYIISLPKPTKPSTRISKKILDEQQKIDAEDDESPTESSSSSESSTVKKPRKPIEHPWTVRTMSEIRKRFFVQNSNYKILMGAGFQKLTPYWFQTVFKDFVVQKYDWSSKGPKHYLPFLMYFRVGIGKTITMLFALQENPPPKVAVICDLSLIETRWAYELFTYFPGIKSNSDYEFIGYAEFRRQIRKRSFTDTVFVVDESQEYRTLTEGAVTFDLPCFRTSKALFNLTGTPFVNQLEDLFGLNVLMEVSAINEMNTIRARQDELNIIKESDLDEELLQEQQTTKSKKSKSKKIPKIKFDKSLKDDDERNPFHYINQSDDPEFYNFLLRNYRGRVFYMEPEVPIKTKEHEIKIPMTWRQSVHYLMSLKQDTIMSMSAAVNYNNPNWKDDKIGMVIGTSVKNTYNCLVRNISNCLVNEKTGEILDAPKLFWFIQMLSDNWNDVNKRSSIFPTVGYSIFLDLGVQRFYDFLTQVMIQDKQRFKDFRVKLITGNSTTTEREQIIDDLNNGKIDLLLLSKVGGEGINITSCKSMTLFEVSSSPGQHDQVVGRICRAGSKIAQDNNIEPIHIFQLMSTFPDEEPDESESKYIVDYFNEMTGNANIPNIVQIVVQYIRTIGVTVDQKFAYRNRIKKQQFEMLEKMLQNASINNNKS